MVYAALVRVLDEIPTDEKHRADYINDFLTMSKAIKNCQRTDGFWNEVCMTNQTSEVKKPVHRFICIWHGMGGT